jgi:hypothetical protein
VDGLKVSELAVRATDALVLVHGLFGEPDA